MKVNLRIYLVGIIITVGLLVGLVSSKRLQVEAIPAFFTALVNCLGLTMIVFLMGYGLV